MHLSEEGRAQVRPRDFWIAILVVTLVLGTIGLFDIQTGHMPTTSPWMATAYHGFEIVFLLFVWTAFGVRSMRKPRVVYSSKEMVNLVGCTLLFGSDLIPHLGHGADWGKNLGLLLIAVSSFSNLVTFGKRGPSPL